MPSTLYEHYRLGRLKCLDILDTPEEAAFDRIARAAQQVYRTDIALISLLDGNRQWFKSHIGLQVRETPRIHAFCDYTIRQDQPFIVEDAREDVRFADNPLVTGAPFIRFYAAVPIREPGGFKIGTLCVIDREPRQAAEDEMAKLVRLAALVEHLLLRRSEPGAGSLPVFEPAALGAVLSRLRLSDPRPQNQRVLEEMVALTDSRYGMIAHLVCSGEKPSLHVLCTEGSAGGILALQRLRKGATVPLAGFEQQLGYPLSGGGLPQVGHPSHLALPVIVGGHFQGIVLLSGRAEGYSKPLLSQLRPLLHNLATSFERDQMQRRLQEIECNRSDKPDHCGRDTLTGLPDRRCLHTQCNLELQLADQRNGALSVCVIDLDDFAAINQRHGTEDGDEVLKRIAKRLQRAVRTHDLVAAAGGDEFILILRDTDNDAIYRRLLDIIAQPLALGLETITLSASMGVSTYPNDDADADLLLRHAEQAMLRAKESGKNRVERFDVNRLRLRHRRQQVLDDIQRGLLANEFELYYQPKVHLADGRPYGFEALIRWNHPERGLLAPDAFLPAVEATGLDLAIGCFVMGEAAKTLRILADKGLDLTLSINISPYHFLHERFALDLQHTLSDLPRDLSHRLCLEIVETMSLYDIDEAVARIKACKAQGVSVALDDFGTGFSSLTYFQKLPLDEIKIDRSFVRNMLQKRDDALIVESVISLAQRFGRRVVAEGIETQALADALLALGCTLGQGYHYSRPVPLTQALGPFAGRSLTADTRPEAAMA